ncbi:uncharacterized protein A4U43_C05F19630 [Asparagus officinalis]|uniref:Uncharacterized protein n=1 Tax=Asparagus officinalis TaxID=4686 RepID=A0A5P1EVD6_ASPOF|nr:uncharacterized protein A4U43_C05F19630 [Asparagus officinalis]
MEFSSITSSSFFLFFYFYVFIILIIIIIDIEALSPIYMEATSTSQKTCTHTSEKRGGAKGGGKKITKKKSKNKIQPSDNLGNRHLVLQSCLCEVLRFFFDENV